MFGATLTGNEAKSWRKASIGAGSSTAEVLSWIGDKERVLTNKLADYEMTAASRPAQATGDIEQDAMRLTKSYEPDKYEYGYENGKFFREEK
jgi:hypothetical protein